jgi:hypothetical protein
MCRLLLPIIPWHSLAHKNAMQTAASPRIIVPMACIFSLGRIAIQDTQLSVQDENKRPPVNAPFFNRGGSKRSLHMPWHLRQVLPKLVDNEVYAVHAFTELSQLQRH